MATRFIMASKDRHVVQGKSKIRSGVTWNTHADTQCATIVLLMAYSVPGFDNAMGLLYAFFAFVVSAIFPPMCHHKLYQSSTSRWQKILDYILIFISVAMAITGMWTRIA